MSCSEITNTGTAGTFSNPQDLLQTLKSSDPQHERHQVHIVREQKPLHHLHSKQKGIKHKEDSLEHTK